MLKFNFNLVNIHVSPSKNVGDRMSSPRHYFTWLADIPILPLAKTNIAQVAIIGGGGLLANGYLDCFMYPLMNYPGIKIGWGIGLNTHESTRSEIPSYINRFHLLGIRDDLPGFNWVPCASCLSMAFDNPPQPTTDVVVYEHRHFPLCLDFPTQNNSTDFFSAINHLCLGETVITNSYHGMYWGTLLRRRVVVIKPFSSKFFYWKYPPVFGEISDLNSAIKAARSHDVLEECRSANLEFSVKVREVIDR